MVDIIHRIGIKAPPAQVFRAFTTLEGPGGGGPRRWPGRPVPAAASPSPSSRPRGGLKGRMVMEVAALESDRSARWRCLEGPEDWIGTEVTFALSQQDGQTILLFGHRKWKESTESMAHCSIKWAVFLLSLRELVETGKGRPSPRDLKIDNWN